jgi:hypothetical protein
MKTLPFATFCVLPTQSVSSGRSSERRPDCWFEEERQPQDALLRESAEVFKISGGRILLTSLPRTAVRLKPIEQFGSEYLPWLKTTRALVRSVISGMELNPQVSWSRSEAWLRESLTAGEAGIGKPQGIRKPQSTGEQLPTDEDFESASMTERLPSSFWEAARSSTNPWEEEAIEYDLDLAVDLWEPQYDVSD